MIFYRITSHRPGFTSNFVALSPVRQDLHFLSTLLFKSQSVSPLNDYLYHNHFFYQVLCHLLVPTRTQTLTFSPTLVTLKCAPTFIIYQSEIFYLITLFFSKLKNPVAGNNSKKQQLNRPLKKHIFSFLFFIDMSCFINLLLSEKLAGWLTSRLSHFKMEHKFVCTQDTSPHLDKWSSSC